MAGELCQSITKTKGLVDYSQSAVVSTGPNWSQEGPVNNDWVMDAKGSLNACGKQLRARAVAQMAEKWNAGTGLKR